MSKIKYSQNKIKMFELTSVGKKYLEYNEKVGGEPFGYGVGMPDISKYGDIIGLYDYCIKHNITWEKLLEYEYDPNVLY